MSIIEEIKDHEKEVLSRRIPPLTHCICCNNLNQLDYKCHERRYRKLNIIRNDIVVKVETFIGRWKCLLCNLTFTYYPAYLLPYKRYVKENIIEYCERYLLKEKMKYEEVVKHEHIKIEHKELNIDKEEDGGKLFRGSTVWRWLSYFSKLEGLMQKGLDLIRQKSSTSPIFRKVFMINPSKYRSHERANQLARSQKLLDTECEYVRHFARSLFPEFATRYSPG